MPQEILYPSLKRQIKLNGVTKAQDTNSREGAILWQQKSAKSGGFIFKDKEISYGISCTETNHSRFLNFCQIIHLDS